MISIEGKKSFQFVKTLKFDEGYKFYFSKCSILLNTYYINHTIEMCAS